jgi:Spy/CpxP family protein refolding chaperone
VDAASTACGTIERRREFAYGEGMARRLPPILAACAALLATGGVFAQHSQQPYAGQERRAVKALSEAEVADLLAGRGMGLAKAAELNGYPGPMHLLGHAETLKLTPAQRAAIEAIRARMAASAAALGREIVEKERALDAAFAEGRIDAAQLSAMSGEIAALMGRLRAVHLAAHIEARPLLAPHQVAEYNRLRGYTGAAGPQPHHPRRHH